MVKYIANSAAKNMSSEDSQTMVPTLTRFGRVVGDRGGIFVVDAVATGSLLRHRVGERWPTPRVGAGECRPVPGVGTIHSMKVVVYSHDADTRARVRLAIGRRPALDVPEAEIIDVATQPALFRLLDAGGADVMILDGEAQPAGGMGVCRQAKDEIHDCPPVLLIIARQDDGWLATWSGADAVISHPVDPRALASALAGLMRQRGAVTQA
jgi:CheY-like chemotaxis protein